MSGATTGGVTTGGVTAGGVTTGGVLSSLPPQLAKNSIEIILQVNFFIRNSL